MSKKEKLIKRLLSRPKDFTFDELVTLMGLLGYRMAQASGSRVIFRHEQHPPIEIHRPHPGNALKPYLVRGIVETLKEGDQL